MSAKLNPVTSWGYLSQHYVIDKLIQTPTYKEAIEKSIKTHSDLKKLYDKASSTFHNISEAQLEDSWIRPVLESLGYYYIPQAADGRNKYTDHALYATEKAKHNAQHYEANSLAYYHECIVIEESKIWDRDLGKYDATQPIETDKNNPTTQILGYLRSTEVRFGILTNGRMWRLIDYSDPEQRYVEVDLAQILDNDDKDSFILFHFLFNLSDLNTHDGAVRIDAIIQESEQFGIAVSEQLKKQVFESALPKTIEGFTSYNPNLIEDIHNNRELYSESLIFLFRLIFLYYAESKKLLPRDSEYSLTTLTTKLISQLRTGRVEQAEINDHYDNLNKYVFKFVDKGTSRIPNYSVGYNGGLFNSESHNFLEMNNISNQTLTEVLESLKYVTIHGHRVSVDYSNLSVRHLGSVYEGLLEFFPEYNRKTKKIYLVNDKGDRKNSGSYYTPDPIVDYMVRSTVVPHLKMRIEKFRQNSHKQYLAQLKLHPTNHLEQEKTKILYSQSALHAIYDIKILDPAMGSGHFLVKAINVLATEALKILSEEERYYLTLLSNRNSEAIRLLAINDLMADEETIELFLKRKIAENCIYGVDLNEMAVELAKLSVWLNCFAKNKPLSFLDHHLKHGNSLLGYISHKNQIEKTTPITIEDDISSRMPTLATMINSISTSPSNNLVEVGEKYIKYAENIVNNQDYKRIKNIYDYWVARGISTELTTQKVSKLNIKSEEQIPEQYSLLDITAPKQLKLPKSKVVLQQVNDKLLSFFQSWLKGNILSLTPEMKVILEKSTIIANEYNFFHWELEFPEVFYRSQINNESLRGFDIVLANPPYIGEKGHKDIFRIVKNGGLGKFYVRKMDLYYFFFHLAICLGNSGSEISFITTNYYITATSANNLRKNLKEHTTITSLINLNELKIFKSAKGQNNMVIIFKNNHQPSSISNNLITYRKGLAGADLLDTIISGKDPETAYYKISQNDLFDGQEYYLRLDGVKNSNTLTQNILNKIRQNGQPLELVCHVNMGVQSGADLVGEKLFNRAIDNKYLDYKYLKNHKINIGDKIYIIDEPFYKTIPSIERSIIRPFIKNSEIQKYQVQKNRNNYYIYVDSKVDINKYPTIKEHLLKYRPLLRAREQVDDNEASWYRIRGSKREFIIDTGEHIICPYRAKTNIFALTNGDIIGAGDVYYITRKDPDVSLKFILGVLNSKLIYHWLYYRGKRKGETLELYKTPLSEIPIKKINNSEQKPYIELVDKIIKAKKDNPNSDISVTEKQIDQLVYKLYGLTEEEIKIVEAQ